MSLLGAKRFKEAKSVLRKTISVAQRVCGRNDARTHQIRCNYAMSLYEAPAATLDDLREAVTMLEDAARIARRVLGPSHPSTEDTVHSLQKARAALAARDVEALRVGAMRV